MSTNTAANRKNEKLSVPKKNSRKLKESARQRIDRNNNIVGLQVSFWYFEQQLTKLH